MAFIRWVPLWNAPLRHRLEVLAAFLFIMLILIGQISGLCVTYLMLFHAGPIGKLLSIAYLIFMISDIKAGDTGARGQGSSWVREWSCWKHLANYFPIKLIKTVDLPPIRNYLFACFPHGVVACGTFTNFATIATGFHEKFPGIRSKLSTVSFHFYIPLWRELILSWGMMLSNYNSIKKALSQSTDKLATCNKDGFTSNGVAILVGGSQEALYSRPGIYKFHITKRKGFIKLAIQTGAYLVPVISFGEVDVYDVVNNEPGTRLRKFQDIVKRLTGISPIIFNGRGFFQYSFGLIPRRKPIYTVVGAAIPVIQNETPAAEEIDELHKKFMEEIEKLFEEHKSRYIENAENVKLIIV